jgi:hypothetical protein
VQTGVWGSRWKLFRARAHWASPQQIGVPRRRRGRCAEGGEGRDAGAPAAPAHPLFDDGGGDDDPGVEACEVCGDCGGDGGGGDDPAPAPAS